MEQTRIHFGSRLGAILAAAGSAVGLGNIWRFPSEAGQNGGAAFMLLYVVCIAVIAVPVLIIELATGRAARSNVYDTFSRLGGSRLPSLANGAAGVWRAAGALCVMAGFLVFAYYSVVAGWTLHYVEEAIMGRAAAGGAASFAAFIADPLRPALWTVLFVALTTGIVILGVQKGIERGSKVMMPVLFVLLLVLAVCSLTLPGAWQGVEFLFKPDLSKLTPSTALDALGQAFFTLSVGIGCLLTYASYFSPRVNIVKDAYTVALIDTLVAVTAGLIIFPAAMSVGVSPDAGPTLVFITLPSIFAQAFGSVGWLCYGVTLLFFLLLTMAALTSSISMLEITTAFVSEKCRCRRATAATALGVATALCAVACSLSFGPWEGVRLGGMGLFDMADFFVAKLAMPVGAVFLCLLVRHVGEERMTAWLTNGGTLSLGRFPHLFFRLTTWVIPPVIVVIFINELMK